MIARLRLAVVVALAGATFGTAWAAAPDYPNRPLRMIVPFAPGGATDIIARHVATRMNEAWGQPVVVDNRSGASGNLALDAAARATPDGYTLFVGNVSTNAINETTFAATLRSKPSRDLAGVTNLIEIPHILAVHPAVPATTVRQFVERAKAPGFKLNYGSAGIGTYPHLDMVVFSRAAGFEGTHIPYKGGAGQMVPAIISGEVQAIFVNLASTLEHVRSGRIRALATAAPARLAELPSVPTMTESGFPGIGTNAWNGMFVPAAVPKPVLQRIHAKVTELLSRQDMRETLAKQMMTPSPSKSPEDFTAFVRREAAKWAKVVQENQIKVE